VQFSSGLGKYSILHCYIEILRICIQRDSNFEKNLSESSLFRLIIRMEVKVVIHTKRLQSRIFLFSRPSFLTGVARIADPLGRLNHYNVSESDELADYRALLSDWATVGDDLASAIKQYDVTKQNRHDR